MNRSFALLSIALALGLTGCSNSERLVERGETLLSISATGKAESQPDQARFSAGISTIRGDAVEANKANADAMDKVVAALAAQGVDKKDIQTQTVSVRRIDYGSNKGKFEANNQVSVRVRKVDTVGAVIGAVTAAGANVLNGPQLTQADPEAAKLSAYGAAYKAARAKAEAYANAADMTIARVITITDQERGGGDYPYPVDAVAYEMAEQAGPPPVVSPQSPPVYGGTNTDTVTVTVQFALESK